jgi:hypothetical protein
MDALTQHLDSCPKCKSQDIYASLVVEKQKRSCRCRTCWHPWYETVVETAQDKPVLAAD